MAFHVGQKVVCVKEGLWGNEQSHPEFCARHGIVFPRKGHVLTIRTIAQNAEGMYLRFDEILNPIVPTREGLSEFEFASYRFRPIVERKNDGKAFVEKLRKFCIPTDQKVQA